MYTLAFIRKEHKPQGWFYYWTCICHPTGFEHPIGLGPYPDEQADDAMDDADSACQVSCPDL